MLLLLLSVACSGGAADKVDDSAVATDDSAVTTDDSVVDTGPFELFGTRPDTPISAPEFAAVNQADEPRSRPDLIGHPTVMWFFPAADTFG